MPARTEGLHARQWRARTVQAPRCIPTSVPQEASWHGKCSIVNTIMNENNELRQGEGLPGATARGIRQAMMVMAAAGLGLGGPGGVTLPNVPAPSRDFPAIGPDADIGGHRQRRSKKTAKKARAKVWRRK